MIRIAATIIIAAFTFHIPGVVQGQSLTGPGCPGAGFRSIPSDQAVTMTVVNSSSEPVSVYWSDLGGSLNFYMTLNPGQSYNQPTFASHSWIFWQGNRCEFYFTMPTVDQTVTIR